MKVLLQDKFFDPDGTLHQPGVRELPSAWKKRMPKSAKVVPDHTPVDEDVTTVDKPQALRELSPLTPEQVQDLRDDLAAEKEKSESFEARLAALEK